MKPKLRSKNNLPRMRHTFYTPTTHSWFRSKIIETLTAHVHSVCSWQDTHIHVGISACLSPFLQKKTHFIHDSLKENMYRDVKST